MSPITRVLVTDPIQAEFGELLRAQGIEVVEKKLSKEELVENVGGFDCLAVRSATKVTKEVLEAAGGKLKLIGRAGVGVDNIDVGKATEKGVYVMNSASGSTIR